MVRKKIEGLLATKVMELVTEALYEIKLGINNYKLGPCVAPITLDL